MKSLLFATHNENKLREVRAILSGRYEILGLSDLDLHDDIPEPYDTFEANARAKALYAFQKCGIPAFSDDSGLEVDALDKRPGVLSARYAGPKKSSTDNMQKVLSEMGDTTQRTARFVAVFAFVTDESQCQFFKGTVEGSIGAQAAGDGGFGYDPIFIPAGFDQSFGQLHDHIKKAISHRAKALAKLTSYLESNHLS